MSYATIIWSWTVHSDPLMLVRMVSRLFQLLLLFMFRSAVSSHMNHFDWTKLAIFGLIQIWECALNWIIVELVHKHLLDNCHLHDLGATYPWQVFRWSLCAIDSQLIWKFAWHSNAAYPKHLLLELLVGHVEGGCKSKWKVCTHCCHKLQSFPKIHKIMVSRYVSWFE